MSPLLKRLAFEADIYTMSKHMSEADDASLRKFADLIIQECLQEIDSVSTGDHGRGDWDYGYDAGLRQAGIVIREHFN